MAIQVDMDAVGEVLRETAETVIAPRFRALATHEIEEKSPGEVVTIADREAETIITGRLREVLPGVPVIGEEAIETAPELLDAIATEPLVWLVDPLDGTANFAAGDGHWAMMVALMREGQTAASWVYRHTDRRLYVAEQGGGAWRDEVRLRCPTGDVTVPELRGAVLQRFLTHEERARMLPQLEQFGSVSSGFQCAGYEYPAIIAGEQDFALFQRLLPWDHAPGALLLQEAGGVARRPDGSPYRPADRQRGLLLAASPEMWSRTHEVLYGQTCKE